MTHKASTLLSSEQLASVTGGGQSKACAEKEKRSKDKHTDGCGEKLKPTLQVRQ